MDDNVRIAHIETINRSLKLLVDNDLWEDFREIILEGIVTLSTHNRKVSYEVKAEDVNKIMY